MSQSLFLLLVRKKWWLFGLYFVRALEKEHLFGFCDIQGGQYYHAFQFPRQAGSFFYAFIKLVPGYYLSARNIAMFFSQLHGLIKQGMPLYQAANYLMRSTTNMQIINSLFSLANYLDLGQSLGNSCANSFEFLPENFKILFQQAVGRDEILHIVNAVVTESQHKKEGRYYLLKLIIPFGAILVSIFVYSFIFVRTYFEGYETYFYYNKKAEPTWFYILYRDVFGFYQTGWIKYIGLSVLVMFVWRLSKKYQPVALFLNKVYLRIPVVGFYVRSRYAGMFLHALKLSIDRGERFENALSKAMDSLPILYYRKQAQLLVEKLHFGIDVRSAFADFTLFTPAERDLLVVSFETKSAKIAVDNLNEYYTNIMEVRRLYVREILRFVCIAIVAGLIVFGLYVYYHMESRIMRWK